MKKILVLLLSFGLISETIGSVDALTRKQRTRYNSNPSVIYVYQNIPNGYISPYNTGGYPGCGRQDLLIGGQIWASCNATSKSYGSTDRSGWFFANDLSPTFLSYNGASSLEWLGKVSPVSSWGDGPCANGYRLPTRSEWETAMSYARQNGTSIASLLNLPTNGGYRGYKDTDGNIRIEARTDVAGSYWSSTYSFDGGYFPMMMKIGSVYQNYRIDGTYNTYNWSGYNWQYNDTGLALVAGTSTDLGNVRCIRK